ncbi:MAG: MFS transporter, partial [Candidatus Adiutrix sp.]
MGILYSWSVFVAPLEAMFGWSRSQTSLTFSLIMFFMGLGMFSGGKIMEKIGPVKSEMLGGFLLGSGFFLASYTTSLLWLYLTYGAMAGYGLGVANIVPISTAMRWFPDKKGLIGGLVT